MKTKTIEYRRPKKWFSVCLFYWFTDVDECMIDADNCDQNATCMNSIGSFICTCDSGFSGNGTVCRGKKSEWQ